LHVSPGARSIISVARRNPPSKRAARRARERAHAALVQDLERLWQLSPGGAPDRPIPIESPAQVEPRAEATRCPLCERTMAVEAHEAVAFEGELLRVARLRCGDCGMRRAQYFRLSPGLQ
jgi:hypothetical protein